MSIPFLTYTSVRMALESTIEESSKTIFTIFKFEISGYTQSVKLLNISTGNISYELVKLRNEDYLCQINNIKEIVENDKEVPEEEAILSKVNDLTEVISSSLKDTCLFYISGYWTYCHCKDNQLVQFYGSPNDYLENNWQGYVLGKYKIEDQAIPMSIDKEDGLWYLGQTLNDGTLCDLTGKPRSVDIHYVCDPSQTKPTFNWAREYKTCQYLAEISIPELCNDTLLRTRIQPLINEIQCKKVIDIDEHVVSKNEIIMDEIFIDHSKKISLDNYELNKLGPDLFSGKPKDDSDNLIIIIDISDKDDLIARVGEVYFSALKNDKLTRTKAETTKLFTHSLHYFYTTYIYNKSGEYVTTVEVEFERKEYPVISIRKLHNKSKQESNVREYTMLPQFETSNNYIINAGRDEL
ncbi:hypothetical protein WICMUC_004394 [Wickerhamomyces mucosus]|uniref:Endoplasmic reticulum lectin n=1 Tax=Wickerhamomyces mucosus TaxID=1378264 RepID=A0A9P8PJ78_9ASCO|nr:hypothetical protein WICMUC_004394 [Wickerhamomyces mucosus]